MAILYDKTGREIKRGDVYFMEPPLYTESTCLIEKVRPYLVHRVDYNSVVASPITESDKSKYQKLYVRIFDKRRDKYKYIACHVMTTIPVEKIENFCFTLSDYNMDRVTKLAIKNIHDVDIDNEEEYKEQVQETVQQVIPSQPTVDDNQKEILLETIKAYNKTINLISRVLNIDIEEAIKSSVKDEELTSSDQSIIEKDEVAATIEPTQAVVSRQRVDPNFLDDNNAKNYTVLYLNGQFDTIQSIYGDTKNLAHNRIKFIKNNFECVKYLFEEKKTRGRRPSYTKEQNIDYAKHVKAKDFTYINKEFGHTEEQAKKRVANMKTRFDYIKELF